MLFPSVILNVHFRYFSVAILSSRSGERGRFEIPTCEIWIKVSWYGVFLPIYWLVCFFIRHRTILRPTYKACELLYFVQAPIFLQSEIHALDATVWIRATWGTSNHPYFRPNILMFLRTSSRSCSSRGLPRSYECLAMPLNYLPLSDCKIVEGSISLKFYIRAYATQYSLFVTIGVEIRIFPMVLIVHKVLELTFGHWLKIKNIKFPSNIKSLC